MNFWQRLSGAGRSRDTTQRAIVERYEQKRRSHHADEEYYTAMRRLALEAGDASGVRFYSQKLKDLELLRYEQEVLEGGRDEC